MVVLLPLLAYAKTKSRTHVLFQSRSIRRGGLIQGLRDPSGRGVNHLGRVPLGIVLFVKDGMDSFRLFGAGHQEHRRLGVQQDVGTGRPARTKSASTPRADSKGSKILELIGRPKGATRGRPGREPEGPRIGRRTASGAFSRRPRRSTASRSSPRRPAFFIAPAMKPRTVCFCQPILSMISTSVARPLCSIATTWAVLLPSRGAASDFGAFAAFLALGAFLAGVVSLLGSAAAGATSGACAPTLPNVSSTTTASCVASGAGCSLAESLATSGKATSAGWSPD